MIANSGKDENGSYRYGKAGDQTGHEWEIRTWYSYPWDCVLRFEDSKIANLIAELAEEAAKNNLIGYDQNERTTFWKQLQKSGYRPKNINVACESDCSAGVLAICKAVGYLTGNAKMQAISENGYTGNMVSILTRAGAVCLRDSKYLTSDKYLKRGDILLNESHHAAINLTNGANASESKDETGKAVDTEMPLIKRGSKGRAVYVWQAILGFTGNDLDGNFGAYTEKKTKDFQKAKKLTVDGIVGNKSWKAGLESV